MLTVIVALSLLFTMAAGSVAQLRLTSHSSNAQQARARAEAVSETAIARLRDDLHFGRLSDLSPFMPAAELRVERGNAQGLLSFHPQRAQELGIPVSLNNIDSDAPQAGWKGRLIPPEAVQLVAVGSSGGVTRVVETVVHVPRFPYVVSSSGAFESHGPLVLGVLPEGGDPAHFDPNTLLPGHLASNGSVLVQGTALISGDVEAVEQISIVEPARVRGLLRPASAPVPLARIAIADYQPNPAITDSFSGSSQRAQLSGFFQGAGEVIVDGGLELEGAVVYVSGNLHVRSGGVKGKGALITTGSLTIDGVTSLESDQQIALLSQGDVTLNGQGAFRGVVYTEGDLRSTGVELFGALIANSASGGSIELTDARAVVGEPSMNFDEGWLYEPLETTLNLPWHNALGDPSIARVRRQGTVTEDGDQHVIEWSFEWAGPLQNPPYTPHLSEPPPNPAGFLASLGPLPSVREVYDSDGRRVSTNYNEVYGPFWARYTELFEQFRDARLQELDAYNVRDHRSDLEGEDFTPPQLTPARVVAEPVLQTFKLDFNQFLRAEENLRLLLRVDH